MNPVSLHSTQLDIYRNVIDWLPEAVAVEDSNQKILLVNEHFCKLTGYSEEECQAIGSIDILIPAELRMSFTQKMMSQGLEDSFELEVMAARKDLSFFHARFKITPLKNDENQITGRIIILSDDTQQRKELDAIIENDERLRFLMQSTSEGIIMHEDGIIMDVNDAVLNMFGYSYEELIGKSVFQFTSPKEHGSIRQVFREKLMFSGEREIIDKKGRLRQVEVNSKLVNYKGRNVRVITMRDVTELHEKKVEEQRLIAIVEASPMFVAIMDLQGLRYMNQPGRTMLGYSVIEDISKLGVKELMSESSVDLILNEALPAAAQNGTWEGQTTFKRKDGSEFTAQQIIIARKDPDGKVEFFASLASDVTERLKAEIVLKESQQRLRYFMEESLEAIVIHEQGAIIDFNTAAFKMFGYDSNEMLSKPITSLFDTSFHKEINERINRSQVIRDEWIGVKKDGSLFDLEIYSRPHIYKDKDVRIVSILDITTRKKAERALRSSELLLNAAVAGTNVGIWEWNLVTNDMSFNDTWRKLMRLRRDQMPKIFDEWKKTVYEEDSPGLLEALKNHLHGLTPMFHYIYRAKATEEVVVIEVKGKLVRDENNMPVRIVGTAVDITERQQIEDALRKSRAQLAALIENREETIWAVDTEMRIVNFNSSFAQVFKSFYGTDVKQGDSIIKNLPSSAAKSWLDRYHQCLKGESLLFVEDQIVNEDKLFVEYSANPVRLADGNIIGVSVLGRDITQQKNFERSLEEAKLTAETANRTKSQFLANISHEIRTPMNGIIGFTDLLLQTKVNEKQREYLDIVRYSADSLLHLINDLLDISKIEAGKLVLANREFDLRKLMRAVMKSFKAKAKQQKVELKLSIDKHIPAIIAGDELRLQQVFVNLIGNAVKFSDHGTISASLKLNAMLKHRVVIYSEVQDEGIGIPKDRQDVIFEAFHQLGDPLTSKYGGTGLGLSITKKLVELMHGTIGVESEPGKGSRFFFSVELGLADQKSNETGA